MKGQDRQIARHLTTNSPPKFSLARLKLEFPLISPENRSVIALTNETRAERYAYGLGFERTLTRESLLRTSDYIDLFGVVGTWILAILALWGELIRSWLIPPKLRLELADPLGELVNQFAGWESESSHSPLSESSGLIESSVVSGSQSYLLLGSTMKERRIAARYYHVRLSNQGRARFPSAHQAQVMITRLELEGPDRQPQAIWQQPLPLKWRYQEVDPATTRTVGPDVEADLFYVTEHSSLQLTPMIQPNNFRSTYQTATKLWVTLQARSLETDSEPICVQIAWDGQWEAGEAEMARHLIVGIAI